MICIYMYICIYISYIDTHMLYTQMMKIAVVKKSPAAAKKTVVKKAAPKKGEQSYV
jgi:hypothetical protein